MTTLKRCVIADDLRASREMLRRWLDELGFSCSLACDGAEALTMVSELNPALVITDLEMPKFNGLELLKMIRTGGLTPLRRIPVLIVTSLEDSETNHVIGQMGGNGVLKKPLDKAVVHQVVTTVLSEDANASWFPEEENGCEAGPGKISPTFRNLLKTVMPEDSGWPI